MTIRSHVKVGIGKRPIRGALAVMFGSRHGTMVRSVAPGLPEQSPIDVDKIRVAYIATVRAALASGAYRQDAITTET